MNNLKNTMPARILIVEDDPDTAKLLENWLRNHHYQHVGTAASGQQAIELALATRPDLAIMDIVLQGDLDGIQTARILKERFDTPVLYLTAYTSEDLFRRARETSPAAYLIKPFSDQDLVRAVAVALDRHRLLTRLRASEAHLAEAQAVAHIGSWRWDIGQNHIDASDELLRLLEMTPGTFEPRFDSFLQRISTSDQPGVLQVIETLINGGDPGEAEVSIPRKNAPDRRLRIRCSAHFDEAGKAIEIVGTTRDVTVEWAARQEADVYRNQLEEKVALRTADLQTVNLQLQAEIAEHLETEEQLRQSEAYLESAQSIAHIGSWKLDLKTGQLEWSKETHRIFGMPADTLLTLDYFLACVHSDDRDAVRTAWNSALRGVPYDIEHRIKVDGRLKWVRERAEIRLNSKGQPAIGFGSVQDITASKRTEQERIVHETNQRDALVREVHHRIKNNLQGVISLLRHHIARHPDTQHSIEEAIAQVNTIAVVHGLQSRMPQQELRLRELLKEISEAATTLALSPHVPTLEDMQAGDVWLDHSAAVSIALILNELIHNAIKHNSHPDGSGVGITLSGDTQQVTLQIRNSNGPLPENLDLSTGRGCGTGLDLVRTLLPHHGAELDLHEHDGLITARLDLTPPVISAPHDTDQPSKPGEVQP